MNLNYDEIGKRISRRRKNLGLKQSQVSEMVDISIPYMSNIERAISIPSTEVIMRLAIALETTPDEFLVGTSRHSDKEHWRDVAENLRDLDKNQLELVDRFIEWVKEQKIETRQEEMNS